MNVQYLIWILIWYWWRIILVHNSNSVHDFLCNCAMRCNCKKTIVRSKLLTRNTKINETHLVQGVIVLEVEIFSGLHGATQRDVPLFVLDQFANVRVDDLEVKVHRPQSGDHFLVLEWVDSKLDCIADGGRSLPEVDGRVLHRSQERQLGIVRRRYLNHQVAVHMEKSFV